MTSSYCQPLPQHHFHAYPSPADSVGYSFSTMSDWSQQNPQDNPRKYTSGPISGSPETLQVKKTRDHMVSVYRHREPGVVPDFFFFIIPGPSGTVIEY